MRCALGERGMRRYVQSSRHGFCNQYYQFFTIQSIVDHCLRVESSFQISMSRPY